MRKRIGSCNHIDQYDLRDFKGRIFFVTDIHGHFDLLHEKMRDLAFDTSRDLLFVGGDTTDRHIDSKYVLDYVNEPWFNSVQGNHCKMYIDAFESHWHPNNRSVLTLKAHGGDWIWNSGLTDLDKILIHEAFSNMPIGIELLLPDDVVIGIIHAACPYSDWNAFKSITSAELEWNGLATAQWSRTKYDRKADYSVKGLDVLLVGHTPTDTGGIEQLGNVVYCDLGSFFSGNLGMFEIDKNFISSVVAKSFKRRDL